MLADRIKETKVFARKFECQIMDKKNAIKSDSVLNQNIVKVYTDGSKLDERAEMGTRYFKSSAAPATATCPKK